MAVEKLTFEMNAVGNAVPEMKRVQEQLRRVDQGVQTSTRGFSRLGNMSGQMRSQLQNVGFQLQDIAIQLQGGTRASVVFAQQGSQLLSIFGPLGALFGTLAAVGIPALAFAFDQSKTEAKDLESALSDLKSASDQLKVAQDVLKMSTSELTQTYGVFASQVRDSSKLLAELRLAQVEEALKEPISAIDQALKDLNMTLGKTGQDSRNIGPILAKNFGLGEEQAIKLRDALREVSSATDVQGRLSSLRELEKIMEQSAIDVDKLPRALKDAIADAIVLTAQMAAMSTQASAVAAQVNSLNYGPPRRGGKRRASTMLDELVATPEDVIGATVRTGGFKVISTQVEELSKTLTDAQQRVQDLANSMQQTLESGFMSIVEGTKSVQDAFKSMAKAIIAELYKVFVVQRIVGSFNVASGTGTGIVGFIGRAFSGARAQGGAITGNRAYMVGEKGPEMIVPSTSGRVIPTNQLGGGSQPVFINQTINVTTGVQQTVRSEIRSLLPQIAESAKAAVIDAKRRGGSYGKAFA